jgi:hypothetical protein
MDKAANERALLRVIRFLAKGDATLRDAAVAGRLLLDACERGVVGVAENVLADAARRGLIDIAAGAVSLTTLGRNAMKRAEAATEPYRAQHQVLAEAVIATPARTDEVTIDHAESPLGLLWRRRTRAGARFLEAREFRAGERLRSDYTRGRLMPRMGINWGGVGGGRRLGDANGVAELTDAALAARLRVEKAVQAVGPELSGVLIDVCCFLKGLEQVEIERQWPARSAKVVLKSGLGALARHYEPASSGGGNRDRPVLHWGTEDYRPMLR